MKPSWAVSNKRRMHMKKYFALALAFVMLLATACSNAGNNPTDTNTTSNSTSNASGSTTTDAGGNNAANSQENVDSGTLPTTEDEVFAFTSNISIDDVTKIPIAPGIDTSEKVKLSVFIREGRTLEQGNNYFTDYLCDLLNIDLTFTYASWTDYAQTLALQIVSGDYPDIIFRSGYSLAEQKLYGDQGMLVNLYPLYEQYGYYTKKAYENYSTALDSVMQDSETFYELPSVNDCFHCTSTMKMWVYQPWLDALGLQKPTTLDQFYDMLVAFRDNDPNGNGTADEIPMAGCPSGWDSDAIDFIMNSFIYSKAFVDNNGNYVYPATTNEYKEGLRYMKKLYDEGLIHPESFTMTDQQYTQTALSGEDIVLGVGFGGYTGCFIKDISDPFGDWTNYTTIAPLDGGGNGRVASYTPYGNYYGSFAITDKCKNVERAFLLADTMMCEDLTPMQMMGKEGVMWFKNDDPSLKGINGETALFNTLTALAPVAQGLTITNQAWEDYGITYRTSDYRLGEPYDEVTRSGILEKILYDATYENSYPYRLAEKNLVPPLAMNESDANEVAIIDTSISDYLLEMKAGFVTGLYDLDSYWDTYINTLDQKGLSRYIEIYQNALNARNN